MSDVIINLANERIKRKAITNGCQPIWSAHYRAWCCTCNGGTHYGDQQSSIMSLASASRRKIK